MFPSKPKLACHRGGVTRNTLSALLEESQDHFAGFLHDNLPTQTPPLPRAMDIFELAPNLAEPSEFLFAVVHEQF